MRKLVVATRRSPLALAQTRIVCAQIKRHFPNIEIEELPLTSQGDRNLSQSLAKIGGKGLFVKELEQALLDGRADFAVHSAKDLPFDMSDDFTIAAIVERDNPFDAMVSNNYKCLSELPEGAVVGTSSLRRQSLILRQYPHLTVQPLRGNINTRLKRLHDGDFDAIILAVAGLTRMGFEQQITEILPPPHFLPAIAQGALALQCRHADADVVACLHHLDHAPSRLCVMAERAVSYTLKASCHWPLAAFAKAHQGVLHLAALVASADGSEIVFANEKQGADLPPDVLGERVARQLIDKGALSILQSCEEK